MQIRIKARTAPKAWRKIAVIHKPAPIIEVEKKQTKRKRAIIKAMKLTRKKAKR